MLCVGAAVWGQVHPVRRVLRAGGSEGVSAQRATAVLPSDKCDCHRLARYRFCRRAAGGGEAPFRAAAVVALRQSPRDATYIRMRKRVACGAVWWLLPSCD